MPTSCNLCIPIQQVQVNPFYFPPRCFLLVFSFFRFFHSSPIGVRQCPDTSRDSRTAGSSSSELSVTYFEVFMSLSLLLFRIPGSKEGSHWLMGSPDLRRISGSVSAFETCKKVEDKRSLYMHMVPIGCCAQINKSRASVLCIDSTHQLISCSKKWMPRKKSLFSIF